MAGRRREARRPIDFYTFVALARLERVRPPRRRAAPGDRRAGEPDLPLAQQTIDILAMLREKTKGNLTPEEEQFLENLLTDLRLRYVHEAGAARQ